MFYGYGDGFRRALRNSDDVLITSRNGVLVIRSKKSIQNVSCTVSRMPQHPRLIVGGNCLEPVLNEL
jgi:alanine racemase